MGSGVTAEALHELPLFDQCAVEDLRAVASAAAGRREVAEGDVVCAEGEIADRWWIVIDGIADVTVGGIYTATIGPGESIGELALLDGEPRGATVTAVSDMTLQEVDGAAFLDVLRASPTLSIALLRELATRLRATTLRPPAPSRTKRAAAAPRAPIATEPTEFDPWAPGYVRDPYPHLAAVRETAPLQWSEALSSFIVTRYEDVHRLARDRSTIGSVTTIPRADDAGEDPPGPRPGHRMMINKDGSDHMRLRRLVSKVFTPRAVTSWQARAEDIVERLLGAAGERDELDVIADYALPLPTQVISEMLGMPRDDEAQLRAWSHALVTGLDTLRTPEAEEAFNTAGRAMNEYLDQVVADKRTAPADDILTALLAAEEEGVSLSDKDVVAQVLLLYIAGHETTVNLIGNGLTHLFRFPAQLALLHVEPGLDANAVEEVLRFDSPAQVTRRIAVEDLKIGDTVVPAGTHVTLALASANHDPRKWGDSADEVDIARPGANEHVSFGGGAHFCLGASLARMEGRIALPRLVRRFPQMAPAYDEPQWAERFTLRGVETLPVTLR